MTHIPLLPRRQGRRGCAGAFLFYPSVVYPGTGVEEGAVVDNSYSFSTLAPSSTMVPGYLLRQPQLAAAVARPVRILPQFESFFTNPYLS